MSNYHFLCPRCVFSNVDAEELKAQLDEALKSGKLISDVQLTLPKITFKTGCLPRLLIGLLALLGAMALWGRFPDREIANELYLYNRHPRRAVAARSRRNSDKRMLVRLWTILTGRHLSAETERRRLLQRYPRHLDLIDSCKIPHEYSRGADLSYYTEPAKYYYNLIVESAPHLKDKPRAVTVADREMASIANNRIVNATWGLIARGAEAIPFAVRLVRSTDRDEREAGAGIFCGMRDPGRVTEIVSEITAALTTEQDRLVIDTLLGALGHLRSPEAIPAIARFLVSSSEDSDTRFEAAASLGLIVKRTFGKDGADAVEEACAWLQSHGYDEP